MNVKKTFGLILLVLLISILGACQSTKEVTVKRSDNVKTEEADKESTTTDIEEKAEAESKLGSRSNPVLFQQAATVEDQLYNNEGEEFAIKFELTVTEVIRGDEAFNQLKTMNQFNEAAPDGYEWVLAKTKVKFTESETQDLSFRIDGMMNFTLVSESGDIYSGDIVPSTEPDFSFELYVGSEQEGYIGGLVKIGEKAQLRYQDMLDGHIFFNLQ
jgi:hypothetical protein